jgi:hypothetical protein
MATNVANRKKQQPKKISKANPKRGKNAREEKQESFKKNIGAIKNALAAYK